MRRRLRFTVLFSSCRAPRVLVHTLSFCFIRSLAELFLLPGQRIKRYPRHTKIWNDSQKYNVWTLMHFVKTLDSDVRTVLRRVSKTCLNVWFHVSQHEASTWHYSPDKSIFIHSSSNNLENVRNTLVRGFTSFPTHSGQPFRFPCPRYVQRLWLMVQ